MIIAQTGNLGTPGSAGVKAELNCVEIGLKKKNDHRRGLGDLPGVLKGRRRVRVSWLPQPFGPREGAVLS